MHIHGLLSLQEKLRGARVFFSLVNFDFKSNVLDGNVFFPPGEML